MQRVSTVSEFTPTPTPTPTQFDEVMRWVSHIFSAAQSHIATSLCFAMMLIRALDLVAGFANGRAEGSKQQTRLSPNR